MAMMRRLFIFTLLVLLPLVSSRPLRVTQEAASDVPSAADHQQVPALFVYGDSTVDTGNNNDLLTLARSNFPPYGQDFEGHNPTGRFTNGLLIVDFLATKLGLPYTKPLSVSEPMNLGVNFASAGAGILDTTGSDLGERIPLLSQLEMMNVVKKGIAFEQGQETADRIMSQAIHYISLGSNDFIHVYLANTSDSNITNVKPDLVFNKMLVDKLMEGVQQLVDMGAKKIAVSGVGLVGCAPRYRFLARTQGCVESVNAIVDDYNARLAEAMNQMSTKVSKPAALTFCNIAESMRTGDRFEESDAACCGDGDCMCGYPLTCSPNNGANAATMQDMTCKPCAVKVCHDVSKYLWWDMFHPTQNANQIAVEQLWSSSTICQPYTLSQLASMDV